MARAAKPHVFLIHGTDGARIYAERSRLLAEFLPPQHRAENLTEIEPPGNRPLQLRRIAADLMAELATPAFFPEFPRVVIVEQLGDLLGASDGGAGEKAATAGGRRAQKDSPEKKAMENFCRFLERGLPQTDNILILTVIEEPDKRRYLRTTLALYRTIQAIGRVVEFKQPPIVFEFLDAFSARQLPRALRSLSEVLAAEDGPASVFRLLTRQVRFLIQAKLLERLGGTETEVKQLAEKCFPPEKGLNLTMEHPFVIKKARQAATQWSIAELNELLPRLERLTKIVYPSSKDTYVPEVETELELFIIEACRGRAGAVLK